MNNITMLTAALERDPLNPIVGSMLCDALMEERDMHRSEADEHILHVIETATAAKFLREATEILSQGSPLRGVVIDCILAHADWSPGEGYTIVVVPGRGVLDSRRSRQTGGADGWWLNTITIGALDVLAYAEGYLASRKKTRRA